MTIEYLSGQRIQGSVTGGVQVCNNCEEGVNCDTVAVNPDSGNRKQYGYKLGSGSSVDGKQLVQMTLRLNNTVSATGTVGIYVYDDSEDETTKVGTLDASTIVSSYADYVISCSGSPTLAEDDVVWWENDSDRDGNGNINTKVIASSFSNPTGYTYVQDTDNGYGQVPTTAVTSNVANICFTGGIDDMSTLTDVPKGSQFENVDTYKIYQHLDAWVSTAGTLSAAVYIPTGRGDKTDGWTTTGVVTGSTYRNELDVWNGTTWSDNGTDINLDLNGSTSAGKVSAGIICAGSSTGSGADDTGCTRFASGSWTTKAVTPVQSGYGFGGGTATNFMHGGGATGNTEIVRCDSWAEDSWTSEGNLPSDGTTDGLAACAGDGTSLSTMFVAGGRAENYADTTSTAESSGSAGSITWSSSPAAFTIASSANVGGGNKTGFWKIGGQPSGSQGKVLYYNGTAWSSKPDTLYAFGGNAGGANNGGTNPIVMGGKVLPVNGSWTTGQYFGTDWSERVTS